MPGNLPPINERPIGYILSEEIEAASEAIKKIHDANTAFSFRVLSLCEPDKTSLIPFLEADRLKTAAPTEHYPRRICFAHYYINGRKEFYRAFVDVSKVPAVVNENEKLPYSRHAISDVEGMVSVEKACLNSPRVQREIERQKMPKGSEVVIDAWTYATDKDFDVENRTMLCYFYRRPTPGSLDSNHYACPLDFYCHIDVVTLEVTHMYRLPKDEHGEEHEIFDDDSDQSPDVTPWTETSDGPEHEYHPDLRNQPVKQLAPLHIHQPKGPSFTIANNVVVWMDWKFSIGFNYREGLTLHNITFGGRNTFYRLSLSEMFVPYGDPRSPYHKKAAFDLGSNGAGVCANNLALGCDCLGSIKYLDAYLTDPTGKPRVMPNVICCHEVDDGILWKHTNFRTQRAAIVRSRTLVVQSIITVSNYEYIFAFIFDLSGAIHYEVRATGIMSTTPIPLNSQVDAGTMVAPGVLAPYHQHLFSLRIDPAVDGHSNAIQIEESVPMHINDRNRHAVGYTTKSHLVEQEGFADIDPLKHRTFKIINPKSTSPVNGKPVGYAVVPFPSQLLLADESSFHARRSEFGAHSMWFTHHAPTELYASGEWTNQSSGGEGIASAIKSRQSNINDKDQAANGIQGGKFDTLNGSDVVLWHTFGTTHNPRTEDWPVMPAEKMTVSLKPVNFFVQNPSMDVEQSRQERNQSVRL